MKDADFPAFREIESLAGTVEADPPPCHNPFSEIRTFTRRQIRMSCRHSAPKSLGIRIQRRIPSQEDVVGRRINSQLVWKAPFQRDGDARISKLRVTIGHVALLDPSAPQEVQISDSIG